MRYWPLSTVRTSPLLPGDVASEVTVIYRTLRLTPRAFDACDEVSDLTPHVQMDGLILAKDEYSFPRYMYLRRPPVEQWKRLERGCILQDFKNEKFVIVVGLH
jgi:hypothetical protein